MHRRALAEQAAVDVDHRAQLGDVALEVFDVSSPAEREGGDAGDDGHELQVIAIEFNRVTAREVQHAFHAAGARDRHAKHRSRAARHNALRSAQSIVMRGDVRQDSHTLGGDASDDRAADRQWHPAFRYAHLRSRKVGIAATRPDDRGAIGGHHIQHAIE